VEFYNKHGDVVIRLELSQRNGLFYTTTTANAINHYVDVSDGNTEEGIETYEEALLDIPFDQASSNINIDASSSNPRRQQLEADLWQARLGHCGEWQLEVIPHAVNGTSTQFTPHPFSTYDHYNKARI
jgi:hypothetical protein